MCSHLKPILIFIPHLYCLFDRHFHNFYSHFRSKSYYKWKFTANWIQKLDFVTHCVSKGNGMWATRARSDSSDTIASNACTQLIIKWFQFKNSTLLAKQWETEVFEVLNDLGVTVEGGQQWEADHRWPDIDTLICKSQHPLLGWRRRRTAEESISRDNLLNTFATLTLYKAWLPNRTLFKNSLELCS